VAWSPDGKRFVSGSSDNTLKVWDGENGQELLAFDGRSGVYSVAWSPNSKHVVGGHRDGTLTVWDADEGTYLFSLESTAGY